MKTLPKAARTITLDYDYAIVKFRGRSEAYKARSQWADFKVVNYGMLDAQAQIHIKLKGMDERAGKVQTIDVDFYLPIADFRTVSRLLHGIRFKKDEYGVLRATVSGPKSVLQKRGSKLKRSKR